VENGAYISGIVFDQMGLDGVGGFALHSLSLYLFTYNVFASTEKRRDRRSYDPRAQIQIQNTEKKELVVYSAWKREAFKDEQNSDSEMDLRFGIKWG
jgi:hypothetical protein